MIPNLLTSEVWGCQAAERRSQCVLALALLVPLLIVPLSASCQGAAPKQEETATGPARLANEDVPGGSGKGTESDEHGVHADAELLALRILHPESDDLLPDEARMARLSSELAGALSQLKSTYPEFARFRVRPVNLGELFFFLDCEFALAVRGALRDHRNRLGDTSGILRTGHKAFDELNEKVGLWHIDLLESPEPRKARAVAHLHEHANLRAVARAYSALDVVEMASPNQIVVGDSSDIYAEPTEEGWLITVRNAWRGCVSGCIDAEVSYFLATGEAVQRIDGERAKHVGGEIHPWISK